jgi:hypothetical protein
VITIIDALVPIVSVFLGAGITYWLNVRGRRRNFVEDQFNAAIEAVAIASASEYYMKTVARPDHMSEQAYQELLTDIARTAIETHTQRTGQAREAIARVAQYEPQVKPFYMDAQAVVNQPEAILNILVKARERFAGKI